MKEKEQKIAGAAKEERQNHMKLEFDSRSENEGFARVAVDHVL